MAKAKQRAPPATAGEANRLDVQTRDDEPVARTLARITVDPQTRNANLAMSFGAKMLGERHQPSLMETCAVLAEEIAKANNGDLSLVSRIHTSQAISLDALFTEMARRSGNNMGVYPDAAERCMRLALKAQAACRATLEALAKLHQPREQTVKHVHVNEGGQAVVADHFHQHTGGKENAEIAKQSLATGAAGEHAALPGPDPLGNGMPVPVGEREAAMQDARGHKSRTP